jgi:hypothetical protein
LASALSCPAAWAVANDGGLTLWINGTQQADLTGVNGQTVTNAKLCLYNVDGATEGEDFYHVSDDS